MSNIIEMVHYHQKNIAIENAVEPPQPAPLRRSQRERRPAITDDYVVYLQESDFDIGIRKDPVSFHKPWKVMILVNGWKL